MTRPDPAAVITAGFLGVDAVILCALGAPWAALILALMTPVALAVFWHVPLHDDVIGLVDMAREDIPDYVPAEWTRENT